MAVEITEEQLKDALGTICDNISVADGEKLKGGTALTIANAVCDYGGNFLFSYETVIKYHEDEYGNGKIYAETAGQIIEQLVYDAGLTVAIRVAYSASVIAAAENESIVIAAGIGVLTYYAGQSLAKTFSEGVGDASTALFIKGVDVYRANNYKFEDINGSSVEYDKDTKQAIVKTSDVVVERNSVELITEKTQAKQIEINEVTFNITQTNNLTIVNALDDIPAVSILLTHINIQIGEQLDLGDKGLYTVQGGDTLSEIAEANGYVTKDLLQLNTWLIDQDIDNLSSVNNIYFRIDESELA